jgi:hypothetical protein
MLTTFACVVMLMVKVVLRMMNSTYFNGAALFLPGQLLNLGVHAPT